MSEIKCQIRTTHNSANAFEIYQLNLSATFILSGYNISSLIVYSHKKYHQILFIAVRAILLNLFDFPKNNDFHDPGCSEPFPPSMIETGGQR